MEESIGLCLWKMKTDYRECHWKYRVANPGELPFPVKFAAASLINGMDDKAGKILSGRDCTVLSMKADYCDFPRRAEAVKGDGEYFPAHPLGKCSQGKRWMCGVLEGIGLH